MRKLILTCLLGITLTGCTAKEVTTEQPTPQTKIEVKEEVKKPLPVVEEKPQPPILPSEIIINGELLAPNSIGDVYYEGTITNNSKYAIKDIAVKYNNDGEVTYMTCTTTIMPGAVSVKSDCFGSDNMQYLGFAITYFDNETMTDKFYRYDAQLDLMEWN